ncbi:NAD-dependent epimerase/dehydratase family protein [Spirosoma sp. SC4-14]|uniref:NAD-dependent epimerase/dehydratase family protein n=1 Tax=Spirosoma sp. SC4-14 TaxID=3128900 RepID=UPI0030CD3DAF
MKTVLLTGANGFLGGHLCRELLYRNYAVRAYVRPGSNRQVLNGLPIDIWEGDLRDLANVRAATYGCDYVIHAAALAQVNPARSAAVVDTNISGTAAVLAAAVQGHIDRLVFVGTANVFGFGPKDHPGNETFPYMGQRYGLDYMDSKRAATNLVMEAIRADELPAVLVHPTFMIGPLDYKITSNALLLALYRRQVAGIPAGGKNYVHVADVAKATVNALTMGTVGESYILGNENLSYNEFFTLVSEVVTIQKPTFSIPPVLATFIGHLSEWQSRFLSRPGLLNSAMAMVANDGHYFTVSKAIHALNLPQTPIRMAVKQAFDWFEQHNYLKRTN